MMGCCQNTLLILSCIILYLGLALYTPLPPEVDEPFKTRCLGAILRFNKFVGSVASVFGYHKWIAFRHFSDQASILISRPVSKEVKVYQSIIEGVDVSIFEPVHRNSKPSRGIIFAHGGGFAIGSVDHYSAVCDKLASRLQAVVIFVDYRKTPENPFPAPLMDTYRVTNHILKKYEEFNINPKEIGIMGDSAGGNLATAVALKLRRHNEKHLLKYQVLVYPSLQAVTLDLPSQLLNDWHSPNVGRAQLAETFLMYMGEDLNLTNAVLDRQHISQRTWMQVKDKVHVKSLPKEFVPIDYNLEEFENKPSSVETEQTIRIEKVLLNELAFPLMADTLANLPKTLMITTELDTCRDDGLLYVQRLRKHKIPVVHHHYTGSVHGFFVMANFPFDMADHERAMQDIVSFVKS